MTREEASGLRGHRPWFWGDGDTQHNPIRVGDSQEEIDKCLNCPFSDCVDCIRVPGMTPEKQRSKLKAIPRVPRPKKIRKSKPVVVRQKRPKYNPAVAIDYLNGTQSKERVAARYGISATSVYRWAKQYQEEMRVQK